MKLRGKTAIITGASSGIGRATAIKFAGEGACVVVADINQEGGQETVDSIRTSGGQAIFAYADVSSRQDCSKMVSGAVEQFGGLDILHNNAAFIVYQRTLLETSEEEWDRTMAVTLKGVFLACQAALPAMIARGGGSIINTASVAGIVGVPAFAAYCAAKGGVVQLTRSIACDYGRSGIRANAICPGLIETPGTVEYLANPEWRDAQLRQSLIKRIGVPSDVANAALFLASDDSSFMTGAIIALDAGKTAT